MKKVEERVSNGNGIPESAGTMRVPPSTRWQVLLMEYELLDGYWMHMHQRIWLSGIVLVILSTVGLTFLATGVVADGIGRLNVLSLIGAVAVVLTFGWWLLVRRLVALQRVTEYRKREIERELGIRMELYLAYLRQGRLMGLRSSGRIIQKLSEGDEQLQGDLEQFSRSSDAAPWFPRVMSERAVWNLLPWVFIAAWAALWYMQYTGR